MSRLWDMGSRLHTVFTPLSEGLPRLHPVFTLPPAHTSIPSCAGTRIRILRKDTYPHLAEGHVSRLAEGHAFTRATRSRAEGPTALPKAGAEPEGRSDRSIAFAFVSSVSAQKTHVKPQSSLTPCPPRTSACPMSYPPTATLDIDQKITASFPGFKSATY
jgi:hypothetical protein